MDEVTHNQLMIRMVGVEEKMAEAGKEIEGINQKLDPIIEAVQSIAFAFKLLLYLGAASAAMIGIFEFIEYIHDMGDG